MNVTKTLMLVALGTSLGWGGAIAQQTTSSTTTTTGTQVPKPVPGAPSAPRPGVTHSSEAGGGSEGGGGAGGGGSK
jgi:hypothetical protein